MVNIKRLFSFKGRIRRKEFCVIWLAVLVILSLGQILFAAYLESENANPIVCLFIFIMEMIFIWIYYAQAIKRCHDRDNSGWYMFIPGYLLWMYFADGCPYTNKYGPDPKGRNESIQDFDKCNYLWIILGITLIFSLFLTLPTLIKDYKKHNIQPLDVSKLAKNEISDGLIIVSLPNSCNYDEFELQGGGTIFELYDDARNRNYDIFIVSTNYDEMNDAIFHDAWGDACVDALGELLYETIGEKTWHEGDKQFWNKTVKCEARVPFIWNFTIIIDFEVLKSCAISAKYVEESKIPLQEIINGIRFRL